MIDSRGLTSRTRLPATTRRAGWLFVTLHRSVICVVLQAGQGKPVERVVIAILSSAFII